MFGDVHLFTISQLGFERFGQHRAAGKTANELHPSLGATVGPALVLGDLGRRSRYLRAMASRWSMPGKISWPFDGAPVGRVAWNEGGRAAGGWLVVDGLYKTIIHDGSRRMTARMRPNYRRKQPNSGGADGGCPRGTT